MLGHASNNARRDATRLVSFAVGLLRDATQRDKIRGK